MNSSKCYAFDFVHEEFSCLDPRVFSQIVPRSQRLDAAFKIFTIFRDPIERIGAQAFYGAESVGFRTLEDTITTNCYSIDNRDHLSIAIEIRECEKMKGRNQKILSNFCECIYKFADEGLKILKTNATLWFEWFKSQTFNDAYMPNYFIKRLLTGHSSQSMTATQELNSCIKYPEKNCSGKTLLRYSMPVSRCLMTPLLDSSETLQFAKNLLENQLDFFILEKYNEPGTIFYFSTLLRESNLTLISHLLHSGSSNFGLLNLLSYNSTAYRYNSISS